MYRILKLLKTSPLIESYELLDFKSGKNFYYIKGKIALKNKSILYFRQFLSENEHLYSYHWQKENGKLIIRWDNAPHHKQVKTHPHHKHTPKVVESKEMTLEEILDHIKNRISKTKI
ncbi:MAG: toxin-antitoxin system TumE family protein [Candidatus Heimdallarchaeota archaeon]